MNAAPYPPIDGTQPCAQEEPELFFPNDQASTFLDAPAAINACRRCPFIRPCLAYALTHAVDGIWGGTYAAQRVQLRKAHSITAIPMHVRDYASQHDVVELERGGPRLTSPDASTSASTPSTPT